MRTSRSVNILLRLVSRIKTELCVCYEQRHEVKEVAVHQNGQTAMRKVARSGEVADSNLYE
jgi:hypothetical protein